MNEIHGVCGSPLVKSGKSGPGGPGRLPARGSHRSVRARLTHTVPPVMDSLRAYTATHPVNAIRRRFVDTVSGLQCIRRISFRRLHDQAPRIPPRGPGGSRSPASAVLSGRYDFPPPFPPRFVSFAWRYHPCALCSLPAGTGAAPEVLGFWSAGALPATQDGDDWISHVPEEPACAFALLSDPGGTERIRPFRCVDTAPDMSTTKAPTNIVLSRLNHTASALAVYASQDGSPHHHARLASGCWSGSAGWG